MVVIIMGVSGSGKTTIGRLLADRMDWRFFDADAFHPPENVQKMSAGIPLDDEDRRPWLSKLRKQIVECLEADEDAVLACSALKEDYRKQLMVGDPSVRLVYLDTDPSLARQRLQGREDHFMPADLVKSQFKALEEPEEAIKVPAKWAPARIVNRIRQELVQGS
ncbi:MAG: gluconokinase [Anaerolineales bacterium]